MEEIIAIWKMFLITQEALKEVDTSSLHNFCIFLEF